MMLENLSHDGVARGGTMIGDAIRKALDEVFDDQEKRFKDVILITDGEDHDSFPVEAAAARLSSVHSVEPWRSVGSPRGHGNWAFSLPTIWSTG